jgi:hypothetical protein
MILTIQIIYIFFFITAVVVINVTLLKKKKKEKPKEVRPLNNHHIYIPSQTKKEHSASDCSKKVFSNSISSRN